MPTIVVNKILDDVRALGCSDLHFTVGINPVVRLHGQLRKMSSYPEMTDEMIAEIVEQMTNEQQRQNVVKRVDTDFSYTTRAGFRHRCNIFHQRDHLAVAIRLLRNDIPTLDDLFMPPIMSEFAMRPRGLVLITGPDLEHVWEQNTCTSDDIHEITIHFDLDLNDSGMFGRNPFNSMRQMMEAARKGLAFPLAAIMKVYNQLNTLMQETDHFYAFIKFLTILYELSRCDGARTLATSSYAKVEEGSDSRRVQKVKSYINKHYREDIRLATLSDIAGMSPSAFSRFFKLHTGRNLTDYIIDQRLGYASRMLVDSTHSISEISYACGFNNLSNFNRIFRKKKGCSPSEFRDTYHKTRIIV